MSPRFALRPATDADMLTVLRWRNHPEVRQVMFTDHEIAEAEHRAWWQGALQDPRYRLLICQWQGADVGTVNFSAITPEHCDWGFYFDPEAFEGLARLQAWHEMEKASLAYARDTLGCRRIRCEVFAFNTAVLAMHQRHGFQECGRYSRQRGGESLLVIQLERSLRDAAPTT